MKILKKNHLAFTLIEVIVAVVILSIMMISVMQIFISSTDINLKTDITRALQQNIKSAVEVIAEDVRKNGFQGVNLEKANSHTDPNKECDLEANNTTWTLKWTKLCTTNNEYYLAKKTTSGYSRVDDISQCEHIEDGKSVHCSIVNKNNKPLMNSWVDVKNLEFKISDNWVKKVTILMTLQPAMWKWIKSNLIKENRFHFQTTISERPNLN